jgi:NAD(P)-dependent dehydrogenase (short-subunit alcohol dehydrogenase family)
MGLPQLRDRCAVITGASQGLGAGLATEFARRGLCLGLCARSEPVLASGERVVAARVDVRDAEAMESFGEEVEARFGPIHLWINNAGVLDPVAPVRDVEIEEFRFHIDVNLTGIFIGTRFYVRHLHRRGGGGVLINVSSGAAWSAYAGWGAYCAGKAAVERLTECVQLEEGEAGLRAFSVAPGVIDTDMQALIRACPPERFPMVEKFHEMKREGSFNTVEFVAAQLLEIAFDPTRRESEVAIRLPDEKS